MKKSNMRFGSLLLTLLLVFMMSVPTVSAAGEPTVDLGTTETFALLANQSITNTGTTIIKGSVGGDIGLSPGEASSFTGQESMTVSGSVYTADAVALQAQVDLLAAYNDTKGRPGAIRISSELGGTTLTPGVYDSADGKFSITGTLTLDAQGDDEGVFIFKTGSTLTTASGSNVSLINSARFCRTFWQVGSSATLGTNSHFVGHIFAKTSITATTGATVQGQLMALDASITLDSNTIDNGICAAAPDAATLHVIKHVINDDGRSADASDFTLHVKASGIDVAASPGPGAETPGTTYTLAAGTYVVSEEYDSRYIVSYKGDSDSNGNITLSPGDDKTVTVTNDDRPRRESGGNSSGDGSVDTPASAILHVIKHVVNDDGRTAEAADFNLHIKTSDNDVVASPAPGVESPGTTYTLAAGTYVVSEEYDSRYTVSYSGDSDSSGNITLASGDNKTVTITNNDIPLPEVVVTPPVSGGEVVVTPPVSGGEVVETTVTGGELPKTSTYLYEILIIGAALMLVGAVGWLRRKRYV